jgi:hypothetical protein
MFWNGPVSSFPIAVTAPMITVAMKAAIKQYSIAVTPRLSERSASNSRKKLSTALCPLPTETDDQSAAFISLFYMFRFKENLIPLIIFAGCITSTWTHDWMVPSDTSLSCIN